MVKQAHPLTITARMAAVIQSVNPTTYSDLFRVQKDATWLQIQLRQSPSSVSEQTTSESSQILTTTIYLRSLCHFSTKCYLSVLSSALPSKFE